MATLSIIIVLFGYLLTINMPHSLQILMLHSMIHHYCTIHRNKSYIGIRTFHSTQWLEHHFCRDLYIKEFFWAGCLDSFLCCWKLSHNYFLTIIVTKNLRIIPRTIITIINREMITEREKKVITLLYAICNILALTN